MFDRAIIETDKFLNVSLSAKALYFLLGMEADDEGFVSPNRVMRLYGAEMGDLKNLIDTGLVIPFKSGVVVITDWKQNNWLDTRRIKPTQYQEEKKQLQLLPNNKYLLSSSLASAEPEEYRGEEYSTEEKRGRATKVATPSDVSKMFFSLEENRELIIQEFIKKGVNEDFIRQEIKKFVSYWTELNKSGTKQRWEGEKYFDVSRRIGTWIKNSNKFSVEKTKKIGSTVNY